jgi:DNA mismatch repair ATPase MutL
MTDVDGLPPDELRELVREVLREALPELGAQTTSAAGPVPESTIPDNTKPDSTRSDSTRSDSTSSDSTISDSTISDNSSAESTRPESTRPESTRPESTRAEGTASEGTALPGVSVQEVRLSTNDELRAFVLQILRLAENPERRTDILAGRLRFVLAGPAGPAAPAVIHRVDKGAVTERAVIGAARAGARLVLGPRAVLTPLARDKARALRVPVEKER